VPGTHRFSAVSASIRAARRSITYASKITCGDGEVTIATGTFTAVCVDETVRPLKSVDIPADIRTRLAIAKA